MKQSHKGLGEVILKLRSEGKSYRQIAREVPCNKATVWYHLTKKLNEFKAIINHE